jgi:hypothetical protein
MSTQVVVTLLNDLYTQAVTVLGVRGIDLQSALHGTQ